MCLCDNYLQTLTRSDDEKTLMSICYFDDGKVKETEESCTLILRLWSKDLLVKVHTDNRVECVDYDLSFYPFGRNNSDNFICAINSDDADQYLACCSTECQIIIYHIDDLLNKNNDEPHVSFTDHSQSVNQMVFR